MPKAKTPEVKTQSLKSDQLGLFPTCVTCGNRLTEYISERSRGLQCLFCHKKFPQIEFDAERKLKRGD